MCGFERNVPSAVMGDRLLNYEARLKFPCLLALLTIGGRVLKFLSLTVQLSGVFFFLDIFVLCMFNAVIGYRNVLRW